LKPIEPNELFQFIDSNPLIDVRTPAEFATGHIPGAINIPLFSNDERVEVGTIYKQVGQREAIMRALDIVGPKMSDLVRQASVLTFKDHLVVHCWRGGMRSSSFSWLMNTAGIPAVTVNGGYKGIKKYMASAIKQEWKFKVITACTGSGKTELLLKIKELGEQVVDLEGLAHHKGSVFGGLGHNPQPTSEHFENKLFMALKDFDPTRTVWVEDESMCIGHVFIPQGFYQRMHNSPLVKVDLSFEERVKRLVSEYALFDKQVLAHAIGKITKRLGGDNAKKALDELENSNFEEVTRILLRYYDKAYNRSIDERRENIIFEQKYNNFNVDEIAKSVI
jgi:tRNA 2-selenouridine synthase